MYTKSDIYKKTVYGHDFTLKKGKRPPAATFHVEYPDCIAGPFNEYLVHKDHTNFLPEGATYEHHGGIAKRMVEKIPMLGARFIDEPINMDCVKLAYLDVNRTLYQVDYCRVEDGFDSPKKKARGVIPMPDNWVLIPTTYRASYRGPGFVPPGLEKPMDIRPRRAGKPIDNIKHCKITQRHVRYVTGKSEYQSKIGAIGSDILRDHYHGIRKVKIQEPAWQLELKQILLEEYKPQYQD